MIKNVYICNTKNRFKTYNVNILEKIKTRKREKEMNNNYIMEVIKEAEEDLANGRKTYTLEEFEERMEQIYGKL